MANDLTIAKNLQILNPNITKQEIIEDASKLYDSRYLPVAAPHRIQWHGFLRSRGTVNSGHPLDTLLDFLAVAVGVWTGNRFAGLLSRNSLSKGSGNS